MFVFAMELAFWVVWDLVLSFILYFTGAVVIRIFSFGKTCYPLAPTSFFQRRKIQKRDPFNSAFIVGFLFYASLFAAAIWLA